MSFLLNPDYFPFYISPPSPLGSPLGSPLCSPRPPKYVSQGTQTDECQAMLVGQMVIASCPEPSIVLDYIASSKPPEPQTPSAVDM